MRRSSAAIAVLDNAINIISTERARIGAQQNRLEFSMNFRFDSAPLCGGKSNVSSLETCTPRVQVDDTPQSCCGESSLANVDNTSENLGTAESRIRDTDMAGEMTIFVKNQMLMQSSTAMLAQANTLPQGVLQLLG